MKTFKLFTLLCIITSFCIGNNTYCTEMQSFHGNFSKSKMQPASEADIVEQYYKVFQTIMKQVKSAEQEDNTLCSAKIYEKYLSFLKQLGALKNSLLNIKHKKSFNLLKAIEDYERLLNQRIIGNDYNKLVDYKDEFQSLQTQLKNDIAPFVNNAKSKLGKIKNNIADLEITNKKELLAQITKYETEITNILAIL